MTFEQEQAMKAILKAVTDAVQAGLTTGQIIDEIKTGSDVRFSALPPLPATDAPQRYGWSPIVDKKLK